jgi:hypothetical protein
MSEASHDKCHRSPFAGAAFRTPTSSGTLRYDVKMALRTRWSLAVLLAVQCLFLPGCKPRSRSKAIYVRVLSNLASPYGHELDHRILDFQTSNPRTSTGRPIMVQTVEIGDYKDMLEKHIGHDTTVEMIILDTPDDAAMSPVVQADMSRAVNICAALKACPADVPSLIPSGTQGEQLEGAQKFQEFLQKAPAS